MATISEALAIAIEHHQAGRLQPAEQIYRQILALQPDHADALHLLGVLAYQLGQYELAIERIGRAIALDGAVVTFHNNLGNVLKDQGKLDQAIACYRRALELKPDYALAHNNLGLVLSSQGNLHGAVACYRRATELKPDFADGHNNLGVALTDQGKLDEAAASCRRALELKPDYAEAHNNLGTALMHLGKLDEAVASFRRALELKPDYAEAHNNLGNAFEHQGKLDEAVASFRRALELKPDYAQVHNNLGVALQEQGSLDEAVACYRRALELKPDYPEAHNNLGNALKEQGTLDKAVACYRRALELKPDYADAHTDLAIACLLTGDWRHGWPEYQWRWQTKGFTARRFGQPLWNGESLAGKTILLHAEQGLGDTIQFIRYAPMVKRYGGTVVVECQKPLAALLEGCPGVDHLVGQGDRLPAFDVYAPLLSLPLILQTSLATIPASIPYLFPKAAIVERWRKTLVEIDGFKVGITWQGNPAFHGDRCRSIPLRWFAPLAQVPGVRLLSLQKGAGAEQLAELGDLFEVTKLGSRLHDFADTAAVMKNLDLVITSDTGPAHLAGALGIPVWVALAFVPDWRWLLDRGDSPWYPTMRLFRQRERGNWHAVVEEIKNALSGRVQSSRTDGGIL